MVWYGMVWYGMYVYVCACVLVGATFEKPLDVQELLQDAELLSESEAATELGLLTFVSL